MGSRVSRAALPEQPNNGRRCSDPPTFQQLTPREQVVITQTNFDKQDWEEVQQGVNNAVSMCGDNLADILRYLLNMEHNHVYQRVAGRAEMAQQLVLESRLQASDQNTEGYIAVYRCTKKSPLLLRVALGGRFPPQQDCNYEYLGYYYSKDMYFTLRVLYCFFSDWRCAVYDNGYVEWYYARYQKGLQLEDPAVEKPKDDTADTSWFYNLGQEETFLYMLRRIVAVINRYF